MTSLVFAIVRAAHRQRLLVAALCVAAALLSAVGIRRLSFESDVLSLLPDDRGTISAFKTVVGRFGNLDKLYVVFTAPEGHAIADYQDQIDQWIDALRGTPEIARVDTGGIDRTRDFTWLAERQLLLLPPPALTEALQRMTASGARQAVAGSKELLTVPSADVAAMVQEDPLQLLTLLRDAVGGAQSGISLGGTGGIVTADGRGRLVIAQPTRPPFDSEFAHALDRRLRAIAATLAAAPHDPDLRDDEQLPPMRVEFAGGHRIAVETEAIVRNESIMNSVGSLALILPLLVLVFRSLWLVAVGPLPSALALVVVLGILGFLGVQLSAAATGAAAMLFGLGVDGVVLLYVAYHSGPDDAEGVAAIEGPSVSMLLGMFTTAATFYGLTFVDFPSLQHLGRLIGHSMLACGLLTLVMVPALLPRRTAASRRRVLQLSGLAAWIARRQRMILVGAAVLTILLGAAATRLKIDPTLDRLRSTTDAARLEESIASAFRLPTDVAIVLAESDDLESLLERNEQLTAQLARDLPGIAVQPASRFLPSAATQRQTMATVEAAGLSSDTVRTAVDDARQAAGFRTGAFDNFERRLRAMLDPAQRLTFADYASHDAADIIGRFVAQDGDHWRIATYVMATPEQLPRVQQIAHDVDPSQTLTGLTLVNQELERRFVPDFVKGLAIGTFIVVGLVLVAFRDWKLSALAMLPTILGLIWAAGLLALAGIRLDLFATFAVVTFVGIGVDYGVHLVHRFQERRDAERATAELSPVILVAAAITMLGYATLVWSSYGPLRSIGAVSAVSVVALAGASVIVLPALLMRTFEP